jgi:hypothetical protein
LGGVVDVAGIGELGRDALVGADHRLGFELRTENISWSDCGCQAEAQEPGPKKISGLSIAILDQNARPFGGSGLYTISTGLPSHIPK